jgi:hypothetical protein
VFTYSFLASPGEHPSPAYENDAVYLGGISCSRLGASICAEIERQLEAHGVARLSRQQFFGEGIISSDSRDNLRHNRKRVANAATNVRFWPKAVNR